jgi:crotonobetainyl-CoA:carnitine CoA-transferase CaiB-like acyl-CoA transferase
MADGPLQSLLVIECTSGVAGAFCARLLADYGATVIKVEPANVDPRHRAQAYEAPDARPGDSTLFSLLNRNKLGATLDLTKGAGRMLLTELTAEADALIEDMPPGCLGELIGEPWRRDPALVVVSITPFGQTGSRSTWKGGDLVACAAGGLAHLTGDAEREPLRPGAQQAQHLAGLQAAAGAMMALLHASRTGEGQRVDVSEQEAVLGTLESTVSSYAIRGEVRGRMGTHHPAVHGLGLQRLHDGNWLFVGTLPTQRMWESATRLIGQPEWTLDAQWQDPRLRRDHADHIDELAAETFSALDTDDIYPAMKANGVPVGLVRDMAGVTSSPQLRERDFFVVFPDEDPSELQTGAPWKMPATPWALRRRAPGLGEHNQEVFVDRLGYTTEQLDRWQEAGVI